MQHLYSLVSLLVGAGVGVTVTVTLTLEPPRVTPPPVEPPPPQSLLSTAVKQGEECASFAILLPTHETNDITNLLFWQRYPDFQDQILDPEKHSPVLIKDWLIFFDLVEECEQKYRRQEILCSPYDPLSGNIVDFLNNDCIDRNIMRQELISS